MVVTISKQITRRDSKIFESFSISPKNKKIWEDGSRIKDFLILVIKAMSISEEYTLEKTSEFDYLILNEYRFEENKKIPNPSLVYEFKYIPFNGKKKCSKCFHVRYNKKQEQYCSGRMKKIKNDYWNSCSFYYENSIIKEIDININYLIGKIFNGN